jgi:hypothetical protein
VYPGVAVLIDQLTPEFKIVGRNGTASSGRLAGGTPREQPGSIGRGQCRAGAFISAEIAEHAGTAILSHQLMHHDVEADGMGVCDDSGEANPRRHRASVGCLAQPAPAPPCAPLWCMVSDPLGMKRLELVV